MKIFRRILRRITVHERTEPVPAPPQESAPVSVTKSIYLHANPIDDPERQRRRLRVVGLVVGVGFVCIAIRAIDIAVFTETLSAPPEQAETIAAERGMILDRDGEILAANLDSHTVYVDPKYVWDEVELARQLVTLVPDIDHDRLLERLRSKTRYVEIARDISPRLRQAIHRLGLPGVFFKTRPGRVYPKKRTASHIVGYTGRNMQGQSGAERAFNAELNQSDGRPVYLSIDLTAQNRVESILRDRMSYFKAEYGLAILMRVGTGEIIAMASLPDFDPNFSTSLGPFEGENDPRYNRAIQGAYELGSVFKPLSLAAGLQSGAVALDDVFDASSPIRIGGHVIEDYRGQGRPLSAREIILYSSNIGSSRMADHIGSKILKNFYMDLHLMDPAPIELAETGAPKFPERWGRVQTMTASFGHGFMVSPLALTAAYAALANGGVYVRPTIRPVTPGEVVQGVQVMDSHVSSQVLSILRENISQSQTRSADITGLALAGKTGTAERVVNRIYTEGNLFTTFVGVFPFDDPRYVLTVCLDRPKANEDTHGFNTAGWTAMPTAGAILKDLAGVLDLEMREVDPQARISTVRALFEPRQSIRYPGEDPVALGVNDSGEGTQDR